MILQGSRGIDEHAAKERRISLRVSVCCHGISVAELRFSEKYSISPDLLGAGKGPVVFEFSLGKSTSQAVIV